MSLLLELIHSFSPRPLLCLLLANSVIPDQNDRYRGVSWEAERIKTVKHGEICVKPMELSSVKTAFW